MTCHHFGVEQRKKLFCYSPIVFQAVLDTPNSCSFVDAACMPFDGKLTSLSHMLLSDWSHSEMSPSESRSTIISMVSYQIHLCHFEFKAMSSEAHVETHNS